MADIGRLVHRRDVEHLVQYGAQQIDVIQGFAIPTKAFRHVVHEIEHHEIVYGDNLPADRFDFNDTTPRNWATAAMIILQNATEDYMQEVFAAAVQLTAISSQTTMLPRDIRLAYLQK